jgi:hypothetical protein
MERYGFVIIEHEYSADSVNYSHGVTPPHAPIVLLVAGAFAGAPPATI